MTVKRIVLIIIILLLHLSLSAQAVAKMTPNKTCRDCHRLHDMSKKTGIESTNELCWQCHEHGSQRKSGTALISMDIHRGKYGETSHSATACIICHRDVANTAHTAKAAVPCQECHRRSAARMVVAYHTEVACTACHLPQVRLKRVESGQIVPDKRQNKPYLSHTISRKVDCKACHYMGNEVGAPSGLPAKKGVFCVGCHPSYMSMTTSWGWLALIVFLLGVLANIIFWFKGSAHDHGQNLIKKLIYISISTIRAIFSKRLPVMLKGLFVDGILHLRLFKESLARWIVHLLVFGMITLRFLLSLYIYCAANWYPLADLNQTLISIETPWVALTYEISGALVIVGIGVAWLRRRHREKDIRQSGGPDWTLLFLLGILMIAGFSVSILAQGVAALGFSWSLTITSFFGNLINPKLASSFYMFGWSAHVFFVYLIVAYLPFSKAWHMLISPIVAMVNYKERR